MVKTHRVYIYSDRPGADQLIDTLAAWSIVLDGLYYILSDLKLGIGCALIDHCLPWTREISHSSCRSDSYGTHISRVIWNLTDLVGSEEFKIFTGRVGSVQVRSEVFNISRHGSARPESDVDSISFSRFRSDRVTPSLDSTRPDPTRPVRFKI